MDFDWIGFMVVLFFGVVGVFFGVDSSGLAGEWMRRVWGGLSTSSGEYEKIFATCHVIGSYDTAGGAGVSVFRCSGVSVGEKGSVAARRVFRFSLTDSPKHRAAQRPPRSRHGVRKQRDFHSFLSLPMALVGGTPTLLEHGSGGRACHPP